MVLSKINPLAWGVSIGVLSGLATLFASLAALVVYAGKPIVAMIGTMYVTYNPSLINTGLGVAIVAFNAFVGCYIAAWVYNFLIDYI